MKDLKNQDKIDIEEKQDKEEEFITEKKIRFVNIKNFFIDLSESSKETYKPLGKFIKTLSNKAKIAFSVMLAVLILYWITSICLGFTFEVYFLNLQYFADSYLIFFMPYSYYLFKKIPEEFNSIVNDITTFFSPTELEEIDLDQITKKKRIRFIFPSLLGGALFILSACYLFLRNADLGFILWGKFQLYFDPSQICMVRAYILLVSFMIGWLGFFGFYAIVRYWTISKNISKFRKIKFEITLQNLRPKLKDTFRLINFKKIFHNHLKRTFQLSMLCYPLFVIGVMYSYLFGFGEAGLLYQVIGGGLCVLILIRYLATGKKLKRKIDEKKNKILLEIQVKINKFDLLDGQEAKDMFYIQKSYDRLINLAVVKKVPLTNIAILISMISLIIISVNIFAPNLEYLYSMIVFYVSIVFMIYFIMYFKVKLSN